MGMVYVLRVEHLQTDLGPLAHRLQGDTTVDECLGEIATMCSEGVCTDNDGARALVGFEKGERLSGREQVAIKNQSISSLVVS